MRPSPFLLLPMTALSLLSRSAHGWVRIPSKALSIRHVATTRPHKIPPLHVASLLPISDLWSTHPIASALTAILSIPLIAVVQGGSSIVRYQTSFKGAPKPQVPSHGVVLQNTNSTTLLDQPPLRVLVLGDSLACGVGQSDSATPVLPAVVAQTLSEHLQRVVYWTCYGEPGASTSWLVHELERRGTDFLRPDNATVSVDRSAPKGCGDDDDFNSETDWQRRLELHSQRYDPESLFTGLYDVIIVFTGGNDLKTTFFPFLVKDKKLRKDEQDLTFNLERLLDTIHLNLRNNLEQLKEYVQTKSESVRDSIDQARETVLDRVEETLERVAPGSSERIQFLRGPDKEAQSSPSVVEAEVEAEPEEPYGNEDSEASESKLSSVDNDFLSDRIQNGKNPLVALVGLPARALPIFRYPPVRWFGVPAFDAMDRHKQKLAEAFPDEVLFVRAPTEDEIAQYENEAGPLWEQRCAATTLSLRGISDAERREEAMKAYYADKVVSNSIFSPDNIHPNDDGYDFWGRHIGSFLVKRMRERIER